MRQTWVVMLCVAIACCIGSLAQAEPITWEVATVHGTNQFSISPDATTLHYNAQPRNTQGWYWDNNNGSAPGVLATGGLQTPNGYRDGSKTLAMTSAAAGHALKDVKLVFDYKYSLGGYTTVNFFMTDGAGKYGIFAPTSMGIGVVSTDTVLDADWHRMTIDLTRADIADTATMAVYEHNGLAANKVEPFTTMQWGDIKDLTITGMYDYQRSPALGWGHWGTMLNPVNTAGTATTVNDYGVALVWGDTVGNTTYATQEREIRNVLLSVGGPELTASFSNATVPEPGTLALLGMAALGLLGCAWRRRGR